MCLHDLFQISAQLKNIRIFDIHFSAPGGCLTYGAADLHSAADPGHLRYFHLPSIFMLEYNIQA